MLFFCRFPAILILSVSQLRKNFEKLLMEFTLFLYSLSLRVYRVRKAQPKFGSMKEEQFV